MYRISPQNASILSRNNKLSNLFERCIILQADPIETSNWIVGDLLSFLRELKRDIVDPSIKAENIAEVLTLMQKGIISGKMAKEVLFESIKTGVSPKKIVKERGLTRIFDKKVLNNSIDEVFNENPQAVQDAYSDGDAINFLIGQVMKKTEGKADPVFTNQFIRDKLSSLHRNK